MDLSNMSLSKYQQLSVRTMSKEGSLKDQLLNMVVGIIGEFGEVVDILKKHLFQGHDLNKQDLIEEIGDVMFYIVNLCTLLDIDIERLDMDTQHIVYDSSNTQSISEIKNKDSLLSQVLCVQFKSGELADIMQSNLFEGDVLSETRLTNTLINLMSNMIELCDLLDIDLSRILELNIDKLSLRYPKGFSVEDSIHRENKSSVIKK